MNFTKFLGFFILVIFMATPGCSCNKSSKTDKPETKAQKWLNKCGTAQITPQEKPTGIDALDSMGRSALHRAALQGNLEEAAKLISQGAKVDNLSSIGTPLYYAVDEGHIEVVKLLVEKGANVNQKNGIGDLPLDTAYSNLENTFGEEAKGKYEAVVNFLKSQGAKQKKQ